MIALLFATSLLGCGDATADQNGPPAERTAASSSATRVEAVVLEPGDVRVHLSVAGEVKGSEDALLAAALGGYVESVRVDPGDTVKRGQVLALIDAEVQAAARDRAEAQLEQAQSDLQRVEKLGDMASEAQLQQARTTLKVSEANARQARATASRAVITAPFAGTVADVMVQRGEVAGPGTPVARLVQLDPVQVDAIVNDREVLALKQGMEVLVHLPSAPDVYAGKIVHVGPAADLRTRSFPVEVHVPNPDHDLLPGMIARVEVDQVLKTGAVAIPQDWVVTRGPQRGVFVVEGNQAVWRSIQITDIVATNIVASGIGPGDTVVITGHQTLLDGDEILVSRKGTCCSQGRPVF